MWWRKQEQVLRDKIREGEGFKKGDKSPECGDTCE